MKNFFVLFSVALIVFLSLTLGVSAESSMAKFRVVHASADAPAIDVYVNGILALESIPFKTGSEYLEVPAETYNIEVFAAGTEYVKGAAILQANLAVGAGEAYTVAAANTADSLEFVVAEDSMEVAEDKTKIRVGLLSPNAPSVNIGHIRGDEIFSSAEFPEVTDYKEMNAGTYDLEIRLPDGTQVMPLEDAELAAGTVYSVFAVNNANVLEAIALVDHQTVASPYEVQTLGLGVLLVHSPTPWVLMMGTIALFAASGFVWRNRVQE